MKSLITFIVQFRAVVKELRRIADALDRMEPIKVQSELKRPIERPVTSVLSDSDLFKKQYQAALQRGEDPSAWEIGAASKIKGDNY